MTDNNTFYIYPHMGLGDQLICNAIVRNVARKFTDRPVVLFCKPHDEVSIRFMYRDIHNLDIVCADDNEVHDRIDGLSEDTKVYIGHHHLQHNMTNGRSFDEAFYNQVGLSFTKRWSDFHVDRDIKAEDELFTKTNLVPKEYIFIHDDPKRNLVIDRSHIVNKHLPVFTPTKELTANIFDYITILDNAAELHCMDSSFRLLADSVLEDRQNLFYHLRLMNNHIKDHTTHSKSKLSWNIIS